MTFSRHISACAAFALAVLPVAAMAAPAFPSAVILSDGTHVPQAVKLQPLHLDNAQREQIRRVVLTQPTEVEFRLKSTKSAKNFVPKVGEKVPSSLKPMGLPGDLLVKLPQLADYGYVKAKDQVLIVDAMTGKIVDMFSETQPVG